MQTVRLVLIVEDDADNREIYTTALRLAGYDVTAVADGALALAEATRTPPSVVLTDLSLPGFDGIELAQRLHAFGIRVPVMLLTGWSSMQLQDRAAAAGIVTVLVKPCPPEKLIEWVKRLTGLPT